MGFLNFIKSNEKESNFLDLILGKKAEELYVKDLMIEKAVDMIAKTISKSEIKIFRYDKKEKKVKETIDDIYYRLNVRVNPNEEASSFFYRVISTLLKKQEALIVNSKANGENTSYLYLADSWDESKDIMKPKIYSKVVLLDLKGNSLTLDKSFNSDDVIHLKLSDSKIQKVLDEFYVDYGKLLNIASRNYKSLNTRKWKFKVPGSQPAIRDAKTGEPITYDDYKKKVTDGLLSEEEAIVMLSEQFELNQIGNEKEKTSEDYLKMIKELGNLVATAFGIPLDVFWGSKTDKSTGTDDFITFAVAPILEIVEDGMNAKLLEKDNYLKGERITIDKFKMKHFDIMDVASSLDKLTGIGFSHNDLRGFLGLPIIDEDWANEHNLTKNYAKVQNVKGGE